MRELWRSLDHNPARAQVDSDEMLDMMDDVLQALEKGRYDDHPPLKKVEYSYGGDTLLHLAVIQNKPDAVRMLVDVGCSLSCFNRGGMTPANLACISDRTFDCLEHMLPHIDASVMDINGCSPLHTAVFYTSRRPLHIAARELHLRSMRTLVARGCDVDGRDHSDRTALHVLAEHGTRSPRVALEASYMLLHRGATPNARDVRGRTPLLHAALFDTAEVAACLLLFGCDDALPNIEGATPLVSAIMQGSNRVLDVFFATNIQFLQPSLDLGFIMDLPAYQRHVKRRKSGNLQDMCARVLLDKYASNLPTLCHLSLSLDMFAHIFAGMEHLYLPAYAISLGKPELQFD
ncbi:hypothetical protein PTSG_11125 [Salpingoeca rosetta]|uniref:Uncharacterized protein n=1 Tax=Salpingoeca rosetta (strain ATCC 50818 / BSB-021) TaxID=946362 RepID=F2US77_SALR5|nr:uncharacterized protein PTSG_11125 [Salpingoeca rosetta]EGD80482.1 hypothetical protein PTSG_11125 [Salpingoeca rosetta]|eukprot:XP_004988046.1 hypothetical protein PTSG_11125 [Salpingoeca rosetta]